MLLGLCGYKGSGKNTVGDYLEEKYGFEQLSFAAKLKESAAALFGIDPELWDKLKNDATSTVTISFGASTVNAENGFKVQTSREFLQRYGTESHRDIFGYDFWVDQVLPVRSIWRTDERKVITDVRFDNEIERIKVNGGKIVNITRPNTESEKHTSEQPIQENMIDFSIENNGSLNDLYKKIDLLVSAF